MADAEYSAQSAVILNVDDDEAGRYALTRMLQRAGYSVVEATTGPEAVDLAARVSPDVVILDVNLPGLDGFEVARRLRTSSSTAVIPILHLSATSLDPSSIATGLGSGADAYLCEPVEEQVLLAQIATLLRMRYLYSAVAEARQQAESQAQQLAIALEELQAANEGLVAANEQLGVANEELEVTNEELRTAYDEIESRGAEVERQRAFLEAILRQVPVGINIGHDASGTTMTTNDAGREIYEVAPGGNVSASGPRAQRPANRYFGEGRELAGDDLPMQQAVAQNRVLRDVEIELRSPSGQQRWLRMNAAPVHDADGETIGSVGVTWDVTEQKRGEEALRQSEREQRELAAALATERSTLQAVLDSLPVAVTIAEDPDCRVIRANPAAAAMFEVPPGGNVSACAPPEERLPGRYFHQGRELSSEEMPMQLAVTQDRVVEAMGIEALLPSGRHWVGICSAVPLHDAACRVIGGVAVATDITERQQMEAALRESEERYRAFFESSNAAVLVTSPDGRIHAANAEACRMFGYRVEEIICLGRDGLADASDPRLAAALEERARTGRFRGELNQRRADGTIFPTEVSTAIFADRNGEARTVMLITDVSARKQSEEEREQLHAQLLAAERARADLAENLSREIAHRTKNNLAMVAGLLQLQMMQQRDPEATTALSEAVSRVLIFASVQQELQSGASGWLDLLPILQRVASASGEALAAQGVTVSVSGEAVSLPQKAATNLAVVANELITNAAKHGAPGPDGSLRIEVSVGTTGTSLRLRVWNSGNPVPADLDLGDRGGLGLMLIRDLAANQYGGTFTLAPHADGTLAEVVVPLEALRTN